MRFRGPRAECDRCAGDFYLHELHQQMQAAGDALTWTGWLVCSQCLDRVEFPTHRKPPLDDPEPVLPSDISRGR